MASWKSSPASARVPLETKLGASKAQFHAERVSRSVPFAGDLRASLEQRVCISKVIPDHSDSSQRPQGRSFREVGEGHLHQLQYFPRRFFCFVDLACLELGLS
jgi:hypothetical protein